MVKKIKKTRTSSVKKSEGRVVPEKLLGDLVSQVNAHSQALRILQSNDNTLSRATGQQDVQISVLARMMFQRINQLFERVGLPPVAPEQVRETFVEYAKFVERPDHQEHFDKWFLGADLSTLPPLPEIKTQPTPSGNPNGSEFPEGATIFGGDYAGQAHETPEAAK